MKRFGVDELYILARRVLLDALDALGEHRHAAILVGAQAIYLHTGDADLGVAEHTSDADLALDPALLADRPPIEVALEAAGFKGSASAVGIWKTRRHTASAEEVDVQVDLLVPASVSPGSGRRAAKLLGHVATLARRVDGMEGALVDQLLLPVRSLEPELDPRSFDLKVAGPGALLISKLFKLHERRGSPRSNDKDALDVLRLLQAVPALTLAAHLRLTLADPSSAAAATSGLQFFQELFADRASEGTIMAARAAQPLMDEMQLRLACELLYRELAAALAAP
jgi:hypothetical protein